MDKKGSFSDVIRIIVEDFGEESLLNPKFMLSVFMDFAPKLNRERELLKVFFMCDEVKQFIKFRHMTRDEQYEVLENVICQLVQKHGLPEKDASYVCKEVYRGLTGQVWSYIPADLDVYRTVTVKKPRKKVDGAVYVEVNGENIEVSIPRNVVDGQTIRVPEKGKRDIISGKTGSLYVKVTISKGFSLNKRVVVIAGVAVAIVSLLLALFGGKKDQLRPTEPEETAHVHSWKAATCTTPKTCKLCGATSGSSLGHSFKDATCTAPKTCVVCGKTNGVKLDHQWKEATIYAPKTCKICGATDGVPIRETEADDMYSAGIFADVRIGDIVPFGSYEQDNDFGNGKEPIEWVVLDIIKGRALLLCCYGIDCLPYHNSDSNVTWEVCSLRNWLNDSFLNSAFSTNEQKLILSTHVSGSENTNYGTEAGNDTKDRLFLLSMYQVEYYSDYWDLTCVPTSYAVERGAFLNKTTNGGWWWLRTPGDSENTAASVNSDGSVDSNGSAVNGLKGMVRPVMWVDTE